MDAILTDQDPFDYSDRPPILVAASSDAAMRRAVGTIEASGVRVADRVAVSAAKERIERQVSATAVWLELDEDCGGAMDELLGLVSRDVARGRYAAIVSTSGAGHKGLARNIRVIRTGCRDQESKAAPAAGGIRGRVGDPLRP